MAKRAEWTQHVAEWKASGQSGKQFSEERGLPLRSLFWWSSHLKREEEKRTGVMRIARVVCADSAPRRDEHSSVEVEFGSARVRVPTGTSEATLQMVFKVLREVSEQ